MSEKRAIIITTCEKNTVRQYLLGELIKLNFLIDVICINGNRNNLTELIKKHFQNYFIFLLSNFSEENQLIFEILSNVFNRKLTAAKYLHFCEDKKSCQSIGTVPESTEIFYIKNDDNNTTLFCCKFQNIYVLPNCLYLVQIINKKLLTPLFLKFSNETLKKQFVLNFNNDKKMIDEVFNIFADCVDVIQYETVKSDSNYALNVILSSKKFVPLVKCESAFKNIVSNCIMSECIQKEFWDQLELFRDEEHVQEALDVIRQCFSEYVPEDVILCFNGGKDCTVLLYLTLSVLQSLYPNQYQSLTCLYIRPKNPFEEMDDFVDQCRIFYNLNLVTIDKSMKISLEEILICRPNLKACLMGSRSSDPYCGDLTHFKMTDPDWPQIMRVNPIINWKYAEVWSFLLTCKIPYCELYDKGFTSLGSRNNTMPNPNLLVITNDSEGHYPAYKLEDESQERSGRNAS